MNHRIEAVSGEQLLHQGPVPDISPDEHVPGIVLHLQQIFQIARVGQSVQVDQQLRLGTLRQ